MGIIILLAALPVHELCHYVPAEIMGLNPSFEILKGKFTVETHNISNKQALIVGLMPIPFVTICIFISLYLVVDYTNIIHNKLLCLIFMIVLSIISSIMISISDLKVLYAIFH